MNSMTRTWSHLVWWISVNKPDALMGSREPKFWLTLSIDMAIVGVDACGERQCFPPGFQPDNRSGLAWYCFGTRVVPGTYPQAAKS